MKTGNADIDLMMDTLGHDVKDDPVHPLSSAKRYTCKNCGCAVLIFNGNIYGSATEKVCAGGGHDC